MNACSFVQDSCPYLCGSVLGFILLRWPGSLFFHSVPYRRDYCRSFHSKSWDQKVSDLQRRSFPSILCGLFLVHPLSMWNLKSVDQLLYFLFLLVDMFLCENSMFSPSVKLKLIPSFFLKKNIGSVHDDCCVLTVPISVTLYVISHGSVIRKWVISIRLEQCCFYCVPGFN